MLRPRTSHSSPAGCPSLPQRAGAPQHDHATGISRADQPFEIFQNTDLCAKPTGALPQRSEHCGRRPAAGLGRLRSPKAQPLFTPLPAAQPRFPSQIILPRRDFLIWVILRPGCWDSGPVTVGHGRRQPSHRNLIDVNAARSSCAGQVPGALQRCQIARNRRAWDTRQIGDPAHGRPTAAGAIGVCDQNLHDRPQARTQQAIGVENHRNIRKHGCLQGAPVPRQESRSCKIRRTDGSWVCETSASGSPDIEPASAAAGAGFFMPCRPPRQTPARCRRRKNPPVNRATRQAL
jgi:hypothetical protein